MAGQLYEVRLIAEGEVRDKDGNVIDRDPITGVAVVTEEQALAIVEAIQNGAQE